MGMTTEFIEEWEVYRSQLQREIPQVLSAVANVRDEAYKDGTLSRQVKELIALGIGIYIRCEACIIHHTKNALQAQATREQIMETLAVAIQMGSGPAMDGGRKVLQVLDELT